MDNPITWAMLVALIGIVVWVSRVSLAFGRVETIANEAKRVADSAKAESTGFYTKEQAESFATGLAALNASFHLFQVSAAEKYITRDILKEFEDRLLESRRETTETIRADIKDLRAQFDRFSRPSGRRTK